MRVNAILRDGFGELYQTQWIYGDGSVDLVYEIVKIAQAGEKLAEELGMEEVMDVHSGCFVHCYILDPWIRCCF